MNKQMEIPMITERFMNDFVDTYLDLSNPLIMPTIRRLEKDKNLVAAIAIFTQTDSDLQLSLGAYAAFILGYALAESLHTKTIERPDEARERLEIPQHIPQHHIASPVELNRARLLLERHGCKVELPK